MASKHPLCTIAATAHTRCDDAVDSLGAVAASVVGVGVVGVGGGEDRGGEVYKGVALDDVSVWWGGEGVGILCVSTSAYVHCVYVHCVCVCVCVHCVCV